MELEKFQQLKSSEIKILFARQILIKIFNILIDFKKHKEGLIEKLRIRKQLFSFIPKKELEDITVFPFEIPDTGYSYCNEIAEQVKEIIIDHLKIQTNKRLNLSRLSLPIHNDFEKEIRNNRILKLVEECLSNDARLSDLENELLIIRIEAIKEKKKKSKGLFEVNCDLFETDFKSSFDSIFDHLEYLKCQDIYKVVENDSHVELSDKDGDPALQRNIYLHKEIPISLYHATPIKAAKEILKLEKFKPAFRPSNHLDYNKVFFTPKLSYSMFYGQMGGISNYWGDTYIIFEVDLKDYELYAWVDDLEFVVWGDVKTDVIKKIYLADKFNVVKEITLEELTNS